jgi:hypothetical protein
VLSIVAAAAHTGGAGKTSSSELASLLKLGWFEIPIAAKLRVICSGWLEASKA